jgi:uncharacterized protein (TIGR02145 family)
MNKILRLSSILFFILIITLTCQKDETEQDQIKEPTETELPEAPEGAAWAFSNIEANEIKGNNLKAVTAYNQDAPIKKNNFTTIISQKGTQIVFIIDNNNEIRGLSYSKQNGDKFEISEVNASSTTNSLFLLVPGMTTTSPDETKILFDNLSTLNSYNEFLKNVQNNLPNKTIKELMSDNYTDSLFKNAITDYIAKYSIGKNEKAASKVSAYSEKFSVNKIAKDSVELSNWGFRKVNIHRCYRENNEISICSQIKKNMNGAKGTSWGSLFTGTAFENTVEYDITYRPTNQTTITDYWVVGLGKAEPRDPYPSHININYDASAGHTIIKYFALPILDVILGGLKLANEESLVNEIWNIIKISTSLNEFLSADNIKSFMSEVIDIAFSILKIPAVLTTIGVSGTVATTIGVIIATLTVTIGAANAIIFAIEIFNMPPYAKFSIVTQPYPPTLNSPINGNINQTLPVTLKWNKNPIATGYMLEVAKTNSFDNPIFKENIGNQTSKTINDLELLTTYYWRVSCTNNSETSDWSDIWSFTTFSGKSKPTLETLEATNISENSATLNGNVTSDGGATITEQGFYWSSSITNPGPDSGGEKVVVDGTSNENFDYNLKNLEPNTIYYYLAYAINNEGTSVGEVTNFTTSEDNIGESGTFTDSRDGNTYKWVKIGEQVWMAENLAYLPNVSPPSEGSDTEPYYYVYDYYGTSVTEAKATDNYSTYGVLYNWPAAMEACPDGWHLPTNYEYEQLAEYVSDQKGPYSKGGNYNWYSVGKHLKATGTIEDGDGLWHKNNPDDEGSDDFCFSALPGGNLYYDGGRFNSIGYNGTWWSATETIMALMRMGYWHWWLHYNGTIFDGNIISKEDGNSVRCVRD